MLTEIKAEKISKAYSNSKKYALRDFDFYAKKGSVTAVIGQNGAGKSTLFKILSGTIFCDEGSLSVCGKTELNEIRRVCSYVPETLDYTKNFTVSEEMYFYAASFVDKNNVAESVNNACDFLSLNDVLDEKISSLSELLQCLSKLRLENDSQRDDGHVNQSVDKPEDGVHLEHGSYSHKHGYHNHASKQRHHPRVLNPDKEIVYQDRNDDDLYDIDTRSMWNCKPV